MKEVQAERSELILQGDRGRSRPQQVAFQARWQRHTRSVDVGLRDIVEEKSRWDAELLPRSWSNTGYLVIELASPLPVLAAGGFLPEFDFEGRTLQDLHRSDQRASYISISSITYGDFGAIVLSWIAPNGPAEKLASSLDAHSDDVVADAAIRLMFEHIENVCISPEWWERLDDSSRTRLAERARSGASPFVDRQPQCLADDGLRIADTKVLNRYRSS